jgi:hypothetical protein
MFVMINKLQILLFSFCFLIQENTQSQSFTHPGIMHKKADLDFVKAKIKANQQPWKNAHDNFLTAKADAYQSITPKPYSSLSYIHHPYESVDCGSFNKPNVGCNDMVYDGMAAYSLAINFYLTDDKKYATKAIEIIEAWASKYMKNTESNARLVVSWATPWYVNAAEILRYTTNSGWTTTNTKNFNALLEKFKTYIFWENRPANNWMMSSIESRLAIAVFQDDRTAFNNAVTKWKQRVKTYIYQTSDGKTPIPPDGEDDAFVAKIWRDSNASTDYVNGLCMETCRDISHTKLGFTSLMNGAEIAWSQGVDLFNIEKKRISDFLELHSNWMMGGKVPSNICGGKLELVSEEAFEIAYNQLHDRLKIDLPKTKTMLEKNRPNSANRWVTKWETLMYANRNLTVLSINDDSYSNNLLQVIPNPSQNGIFNLSEEKNWKVYNLLGTQIGQGNGSVVNLEKASKGIYIINVDKRNYKIIID